MQRGASVVAWEGQQGNISRGHKVEAHLHYGGKSGRVWETIQT